MAWIAVKNDSLIPSISVNTEEKRIFSDILKGCVSEYAFFPFESISLTVYDNFEKPVFDGVISLRPAEKKIISFAQNPSVFCSAKSTSLE